MSYLLRRERRGAAAGTHVRLSKRIGWSVGELGKYVPIDFDMRPAAPCHRNNAPSAPVCEQKYSHRIHSCRCAAASFGGRNRSRYLTCYSCHYVRSRSWHLTCRSQWSTGCREKERLNELLSVFSRVREIKESNLDAASNLTSSAPGFIAAIFEELALSAVRSSSLSKEEAFDFLIHSLYGTGKMLIEKICLSRRRWNVSQPKAE